jgi:DNA-binding LytR/AlgR family response regulator
MQGRTRFAWPEGTGRAGASPLPRRRAEQPASIQQQPWLPGARSTAKPAAGQSPSPFHLLAQAAASILLEGFCPEPHQAEEIALHCDGLLLFLPLTEIAWVRAVKDGVELRVGADIRRLRLPLEVIAAKLPPGRFLCLSPSLLVNLDQLRPNRPS